VISFKITFWPLLCHFEACHRLIGFVTCKSILFFSIFGLHLSVSVFSIFFGWDAQLTSSSSLKWKSVPELPFKFTFFYSQCRLFAQIHTTHFPWHCHRMKSAFLYRRRLTFHFPSTFFLINFSFCQKNFPHFLQIAERLPKFIIIQCLFFSRIFLSFF